ncbi:hypothetical protein [Streptomyces lavendofoliae]|uniref:Uncharacterized protein n=1 Tax=Streptomyces lavendofoliae TaxID=67314 RepID=A0A918M534_9ACTN|nr:hypothetical protein [Streptomyces lavendofoliae]GGU39616.1 hypothetical protein GCM10010274_29030 [Streptomyces lavendofoliae]
MSDAWDYPTPSQAEGEREPGVDEHPDVARSTPSQAEGERPATEEEQTEQPGEERNRG